jgi:hypothetical protein
VAENDSAGSSNPIHFDEQARALGLRGGLVGGLTLCEYLGIPALRTWGADWVAHGSMTARFLAPVYDGERLEVVAGAPVRGGGELPVRLVDADDRTRAEAVLGAPVTSGPVPDVAAYPLVAAPAELPLVEYASLEGLPALTSLDFVPEAGRPAAVPMPDPDTVPPARIAGASIAIMYRSFRAEGPRIHTGLATRQFRAVRFGETLGARGRIAAAWRHKGRTYARNDVLVSDTDGAPVMHVQNTTIWEWSA